MLVQFWSRRLACWCNFHVLDELASCTVLQTGHLSASSHNIYVLETQIKNKNSLTFLSLGCQTEMSNANLNNTEETFVSEEPAKGATYKQK